MEPLIANFDSMGRSHSLVVHRDCKPSNYHILGNVGLGKSLSLISTLGTLLDFNKVVIGDIRSGKSSYLKTLGTLLDFEKHFDIVIDAINSSCYLSYSRRIREDLPENHKQLLIRLFHKKNKQYFEIILSTEYQQLLRLISNSYAELQFPPSHYQALQVQKLIPLHELIQRISSSTNNLESVAISQEVDYNIIIKYTLYSIKMRVTIALSETAYDLYFISLIYFRNLIRFLKKIIKCLIRMQYIANDIHNRLSDSPTPQKKEPPIGGVKVGGKQHDFSRHVAELLYHKQNLKLST